MKKIFLAISLLIVYLFWTVLLFGTCILFSIPSALSGSDDIEHFKKAFSIYKELIKDSWKKYLYN